MESLPNSLLIAFWLTGSIWIVGFIAYLGDAPVELVIATLFVGLIAGGFRIACREPEVRTVNVQFIIAVVKRPPIEAT